eukprot:Pgem_evm1s7118
MVMISQGLIKSIVPEVGCIVYAKVLNINLRQAKCSIICVNSIALKNDYTGIIRAR